MSVDTSPVAIALPVYNGAAFVAEAISSVLAQSFGDFTLYILDNASVDSTEEICRQFVAEDSRLRYWRHDTNIGAARNFNAGFALASDKHEYFKWMAHDDRIAPDYLKQTLRVLRADSGCVLCHCTVEMIDELGRPIRAYESGLSRLSGRPAQRFGDMASLRHWCFDVFGVYRTQVLAKTPLIAPYIGSDRNLLAEVALHGTIEVLPEALFQSREHKSRSIRTLPLRERGSWFAPELAGRTTLPNWRHLLEFARSLNRAPIPVSDRGLGYAELARWIVKSRRELMSDLTTSFAS